MKLQLSGEAARENVAEITKRATELSRILFDIAQLIANDPTVDFAVPDSIRDIAQEFSAIAQLCIDLHKLLKKDTLCSDKTDAEEILGRLDLLLREFEKQLNDFAPESDGIRGWFADIFAGGNVTDLIVKCQSLKEPLRLHVSVLRIAQTRRSSRKPLNWQGEQKDDFVALMAREVECAGSWVETNRQVIKTLLNVEKRLAPKYDAEKSEYQYWTESPRLTAGWIYDLVFKKALNASSLEKTDGTEDGAQSNSHAGEKNNSVDSSVDGDVPTLITEHLEKELEDRRPSRAVIENVLQRWVGLDTSTIRQIVDPTHQGRPRLRSPAAKIANWHLDLCHLIAEDNPNENGEASAPARGRVRTRERSSSTQPSILNYNSNIDRGTPPRAPTPPSPPPPPPYTEPLDAQTTGQSLPASESQSANPENEANPAAAEKTPGTLRRPNLHRRRDISDSECAVKSLTSESESDTRKRRGHRRSLSSSAETIVPPEAQRRREAAEVAKNYLKTAINPEHAPKKSESSKSEPGRRRSQDRSKSSAHPGVQKSVDFDDSALKQKSKSYSGREIPPPERRPQERSSSVRDSSSLRRNSVVVTGEGSSAARRMRQIPPNPRRPASSVYPERSAQSDPAVYAPPPPPPPIFGPPQRQMSLPPPGMMGPWPLPSLSSRSAGYMSPYKDRGSASDEVKSAEAKLQKQIDDLKKNEQTRKEADEAAKLKARQEAEEAAKYQALLQAKELEVEQLKKANSELEEKAKRDAAEKHEQEKRSIEASAKLQAKVEELEALKESKERQEQQCEEEKEQMIEAYNEQLEYKVEELERQEKEALERNQKYHEELVATQQKMLYEKREFELEVAKTKQEHDDYYKRLVETEQQMKERIDKAEKGKEEDAKQIREYYLEQLKTEQKKDHDRIAELEKKAQALEVRNKTFVDRYNAYVRLNKKGGAASTAVESRIIEPRFPTQKFPGTAQGLSNPFLYQIREANSTDRLPYTLGDTSDSSIPFIEEPFIENTWYERRVPPRPRAETISDITSTTSTTDLSNIILFPPCAGRTDLGYAQLGNYLSISGFKAMFEERPSNNSTTGSTISGPFPSDAKVLRGTLFWQPPAATAEADLYRSLRNFGWKPTYLRRTASGQTWFFGAHAVHAQFFGDTYTPQLSEPLRPRTRTPPSSRLEPESLILSKDLVETAELDCLGHSYEEDERDVFLAPNLTADDIDHIVARSFLAREGRLRKKYRTHSPHPSHTSHPSYPSPSSYHASRASRPSHFRNNSSSLYSSSSTITSSTASTSTVTRDSRSRRARGAVRRVQGGSSRSTSPEEFVRTRTREREEDGGEGRELVRRRRGRWESEIGGDSESESEGGSETESDRGSRARWERESEVRRERRERRRAEREVEKEEEKEEEEEEEKEKEQNGGVDKSQGDGENQAQTETQTQTQTQSKGWSIWGGWSR